MQQYILTKIEEVLAILVKGKIRQSSLPRLSNKILKTPPNIKMGDLTLACFFLTKALKKNPAEIAKKIADKVSEDKIIAKVEARGPYVNFFLRPKYLFRRVCHEVLRKKWRYGDYKNRREKILVEYSGPNTNKPLHLGHARNNVLGMALCNILEAAGYSVIRANLINDRGIHINKSILAYQKSGCGKTPLSEHEKGDHFVGKYYVLYNQMRKSSPELENEIKKMLKKWERGDSEILKLWKKMRKWALNGMNQTYDRMGCRFDVVYYESETYKEGKKFIQRGLKNKIFQKEKNGAISINLTEEGLGKKFLLRGDGTAMYITQDIAASKKKFDQFKPNKAVWVVASEQEYHFKVLFEILEKLKFAKKENLYHLSYGMVNLTDGKMKSREGAVVDVDNLMDKLHNLAKDEIKKRESDDAENSVRRYLTVFKKIKSLPNIERRAEIIGLGALKYYLIKSQPKREIIFNPKKSISFDGNTGPYIQYAYTRIKSILRKKIRRDGRKIKIIDYSLLGNEEERALINLLAQFPQIIIKAAKEYNPSEIANFTYKLAQNFNQFYHQHSVLSAQNRDLTRARLKLIESVGVVLKKGLNLLGIETVKRM